MRLFLFLDDWFLDSKRDIVTRFPAAKREDTQEDFERAIWDASRGAYVTWKTEGGKRYLFQSVDGLTWQRKDEERPLRLIGRPPRGCRLKKRTYATTMPFDERAAVVFYDRWDKDKSRRYKTLCFPFTSAVTRVGGIEGGPGLVACSSDGVQWTANVGHKWFTARNGSDTNNHIHYNPLTKNWQAICRRRNLDRRVAMAESPNLADWTPPRVILQPDIVDCPLMQFYGMASMLYEDEYFIAVVQNYHVPSGERSRDHDCGPANSWAKWTGYVDGSLAYSRDGLMWMRGDRGPMVPLSEPGTYGGGSLYTRAIEVEQNRPDGRIRIYSEAYLNGHGISGRRGLPQGFITSLHSMRHDGFSCLEAAGAWGEFTTRCISPKAKDLLINYEAPVGRVLCQVVDVEWQPVRGYTFGDCIPLQGDEIFGKVRWKKHRGLSSLIGKRIRLQFRMISARIYAIRCECGLWYTNTPEPIDRI